MVVAGRGDTRVASILGLVAVIFAMINVVGGYMVTDRMLEMFKGKREAQK
jgi:NAD(P) transhydrogenase subunit alpha